MNDQGMPIEEVPAKVWYCQDCGTISNDVTAHFFHLGHVGYAAKPKRALFAQKKRPKLLLTGETIYVNVDGTATR